MMNYRQDQVGKDYETHAQLLGKRVAEFELFLEQTAPPSILQHFHTLFGNTEEIETD